MRRILALSALIVVAPGAVDASATRSSQPPVVSSVARTRARALQAGTYRLGTATVLRGLHATLPTSGWSSTESRRGELAHPRVDPDERLFIWMDLPRPRAAGKGHGDVLRGVGRKPAELIAWLVRNPDFQIVPRPAPSTLARGLRMTTPGPRRVRLGEVGGPTVPRTRDAPTSSRIRSIGESRTSTAADTRGGAPYVGTIKSTARRTHYSCRPTPRTTPSSCASPLRPSRQSRRCASPRASAGP